MGASRSVVIRNRFECRPMNADELAQPHDGDRAGSSKLIRRRATDPCLTSEFLNRQQVREVVELFPPHGVPPCSSECSDILYIVNK